MSEPILSDRAKLSSPEFKLVLILAAINCAQITDALLMTPLADSLQKELVLTPELYSYTASIYGFAAAFCGLVSAAVIDRYSRKRVILFAFAGLIVSILCSALAFNFASLLIARLLAGMSGGLTTCATLAVIGDVIPESRRGAALGLMQSAFAAAAVIGLPLCFGLSVVFKNFPAAFFGAMVGSVAVWTWALLKLPELVGQSLKPRMNPVVELGQVLAQPNHLLAFGFMLCVSLGTFTVINFMAQYMEMNCGISKEQNVIIFLAMGACSLLAAMLSGKLTDRYGRRPVFIITMLLTMGIVAVVTNLPQVSVLVAGLVASAFMALAVSRLIPTHTIMLSAANPQQRGAFTTLYNSVSHLGTSIGPLIAGQILVMTVISTGEGETVKQLGNYPIAGAVAMGFSLLGIVLSFFVKAAKAV